MYDIKDFILIETEVWMVTWIAADCKDDSKRVYYSECFDDENLAWDCIPSV